MADAPLPPEQTNMQQETEVSPTSTPPDSDTKLSRKREREVSLEPAATPPRELESDARNESRGTRTPAKKNRRTYTDLDPTEEEEDSILKARQDSESPPLGTSPPGEMKIRVRQISQGVEDLSWKNAKRAATQTDVHMASQANTLQPAPTIIEETKTQNEQATEIIEPDTPQVHVTSSSTQTEILESQAPAGTPPNLEADGSDKNLKRKFLERGTSVGPPDATDSHGSSEPLKRPRDDSDKDDNPREAKRPSPPPEQPKSPKSPKKSAPAPKLSGFMAYASNNSPFASVKGKNLFTRASSPSPPPTQPPTSLAPSPFVTQSQTPATASGSNSNTSTPAPRFGFENFAGSTSPFASFARSTSPVLGSTSPFARASSSVFSSGGSSNLNAFANYAGGVQSFAAFPSQGSGSGVLESKKNALAANGDEAEEDDSAGDDEDGQGRSSFGDKLRAVKDEEGQSDEEDEKIHLQEQETVTGEEEEQTIHQVRGKLYALVDNAWKERGTGTLRLNVRRSDGCGARLVMRKEAVFSLLLNVPLFARMRVIVAQDPRYLRFSAIEDGKTTHYNLKLASAKIAQGLMEEINANIPS